LTEDELQRLRPAERFIIAICQLRDREGRIIGMTPDDLGNALLSRDADFYVEQLTRALCPTA
jgi:hypothetical protein